MLTFPSNGHLTIKREGLKVKNVVLQTQGGDKGRLCLSVSVARDCDRQTQLECHLSGVISAATFLCSHDSVEGIEHC
jgi:hypothetical protein